MSKKISKSDWEGIVEQYYDQIYAYAFQFFRSEHEARDATQDAFIKAHSSVSKLKDRSKAKAWLYSIVRNVCIDKKRKWKRRFESIFPGEITEKTESSQLEDILIQQLVAELPERQREVFILRHWHGFSTEETAKLLGIDQGSVKSHLSRAIKKLKKQILEV